MNRYIKFSQWLFLLIFSAVSAFAQSTAPEERDIRIAEGIIAELFDARETGINFRGGNIRGVSGEYVSGYGIHFKINANMSPQTVRVILRGHAQIEQAEDSDPSEVAEVNRDFVEDRLTEYFKTYASLLRGLPEDEVIRLTFGATSSFRTIMTFPPNTDRQRDTIPNMTAWASVSDINAYSNGSISDAEFENRIQVRDLSETETERDQEVFSSILEAALNQAGTENFRIRRNPQVEYIPGLGLNYQVQVSLGSRRILDDIDIDIDLNNMEFNFDSLNIGLLKLAENVGEHMKPYAFKIDSIFNTVNADSFHAATDSLVQRHRNNPGRQIYLRNNRIDSLSAEDIENEINKLHSELRQTVIDYGPTLRSLQNDEMLMITLNWSGRHPALPQRSELRIKKSDLLDGIEPKIDIIERN